MTAPIVQTLDAKLPALLEKFPTMSEEFVRVVAQADPTGCLCVGWLLRMLEEKQWDLVDSDSMRDALSTYDRIKGTSGWRGQQGIDDYTSVDSLVEDIQRHGTLPYEVADKPPEIPVEGAKEIASAGDIQVYEITMPEAAALFAYGQGGPESPSTEWPIRNAKIAGRYLVAGPIYVVLQNGQSAALVHFGRSEAKNVRNLELSALDAVVIAPVFTGQNFATEFGQIPYLPGGWQLTDDDIDDYLKRLKLKFVAQRKSGFYFGNRWVEPIQDEELLEKRWKTKEPEFRHALKVAQRDNDHAIIRKAGRRHAEPTGLRALANAVYDIEHS